MSGGPWYSRDMAAQSDNLTFRMVRLGVLAALTLGFMLLTHPARVPALLLVVPFAGIFVSLYCLVLEVIRFFHTEEQSSSRFYRPQPLAAVIAGFPVLLLVLQSIMRLNAWDVLIAAAIFLLAYVFVSRGAFATGTGIR